jgi:outer membrane protein assembly factor BamB
MRRFLIITAVLGCLCSTALAGNWPRFRGPNGAGVADDKHVPVRFGPTENLVWKTALPGLGNSSPVVWGDRIFLQTASADGKERKLVCLGAGDGRILWARNAPGEMAKTHRKNSLASGTPAVDGQRVCTIFWDGNRLSLHAYDLDGKELWHYPLGEFASQHGPGHSPILFENTVIVVNDQDGRAEVIALDAGTGKLLWQAARPAFRACYSTPFVLDNGSGKPELIVASTAGLAGYDLKDGRELWRWNWTFARSPLRTVASPIAANGLVFANSGDGAGDRHTVAVRLGGKGELGDSALAWESKKLFSYVPTMLTRGDLLFFVNDGGVAACHVAQSGDNVWTHRIGGNISASPILVDGKIYAATEEGDVIVFAADRQYRELARNSLGEPIIATPAVADNRLYIRGRDHLYCFGQTATNAATDTRSPRGK